MEWEIRKGRFMEHGEFAGNLYGTSIDSLRTIMATGYTCILTPHPHALKILRSSEVCFRISECIYIQLFESNYSPMEYLTGVFVLLFCCVNTQLKPHIIFIKPPPFEILKKTRLKSHARSPFDPNRNRGFTVRTIE